MWGTPGSDGIHGGNGRITPTCVGNTHRPLRPGLDPQGSPPPVWGTLFQYCLAMPAVRDHPHLCGEHRPSYTRGPCATRITPTCVGNTVVAWSNATCARDHPHLCGEHLLCCPRRSNSLGSPPPVWGTLPARQNPDMRVGITPTCVGNTTLNWS